MAAATYDPKKTNINEDKLADWLRDKITGDLEEVPGIGPANKALLEGVSITNTFQLIGKYLTFKEGTVQNHQDSMYAWLKDIVSNSSPFLPHLSPRRERGKGLRAHKYSSDCTLTTSVSGKPTPHRPISVRASHYSHFFHARALVALPAVLLIPSPQPVTGHKLRAE